MGRTASRRALTRTRLRAAGDYGFDPMGLASKPEALFWYAHRLQPGCLAAASLRAPLRQSSPLSELWRWAACSGRPVLRARILHWIKITSVPYQVPRSGGRPRAVGHAWRCWRAGSGLRFTFVPVFFFFLRRLDTRLAQSIIAPNEFWYTSAVDYAAKEGSINLGSLLAVQFLLMHWAEVRRWQARHPDCKA